MIINFSIQNFGSIKEKQTLSFEAEKSTHLEDYYIIEPIKGVRLLKLALLYGANASGKTTILKALDFLRYLTTEPLNKKTDLIDFKPFLFDAFTPKENTIISIEFIQNGIKYFYELILNRQCIVNEELYTFASNKYNIFKRSSDVEKQISHLKFGNKVKIKSSDLKALELNTLWNNTVFGGFLKTNIDNIALNEVSAWFINYLKPILLPNYNLTPFSIEEISKNFKIKNNIIKILKQADFNLSNMKLERSEIDIPKEIKSIFEALPNDTNDEYINQLRNTQKIAQANIEFEHSIKNKKYLLDFNDESKGTERFFGLAPFLISLVNNSVVIPN